MMRCWFSLFVLITACFLPVDAQQTQPVPSPERPVYTRDGNTLYGNIGDGPVSLWSYDNPDQAHLFEVYTPLVGPSVVLYINPNYHDTLIRGNIIYTPTNGFEHTGYTQMSTAPIQPPVLFGEDGSFAFVQLDHDPTNDQPTAQVIVQVNYDILDPESSTSLTLMLTPLLPVEVNEDGTIAAPVLLSYTADPDDFSAGVVELQLLNGDVLVASAAGITLAGEESLPAEVSFSTTPDNRDIWIARLGELVIPLEIPGSYFYTGFDDGLRKIYITSYSDRDQRYYWMTLVTLRPFKVIQLLQWGGTYGTITDPLLEGNAALTPDGTKVIFSAYSDEIGASLWLIDLTTPPPADYDPSWDGAWMPEPVLIDSGLPFVADAGNFALPRFTEVMDDGFTIEAYTYDAEPIAQSYIFTELSPADEN